jgi:hypothetical protein
MMAKPIYARRNGMYRCSGMGQTQYARAGETLTEHANCSIECQWQYKPEDNPEPEQTEIVIESDSDYYVLIMDEVPEVGHELNLTNCLVGKFRVTNVSVTERLGYVFPLLKVEQVGALESGIYFGVHEFNL